MATFQFRALMSDGTISAGRIEAASRDDATHGVRRTGARPIELSEVTAPRPARAAAAVRVNAGTRTAVASLIGELAVLLKAGLPLDRSMSIAIANVEKPALMAQFAEMLASIRQGVPLSKAIDQRRDLFPPAAAAMAEAGEANGRMAQALSRLAAMLEQAEEQRRLVAASMIYPVALFIIATGVILLMLLFVVPQFESLFAASPGKLPASSLAVMAASRFVREHGLAVLAILGVVIAGARQLLARPEAGGWVDRQILLVPQFGTLVRHIETARFARTLGALIEGDVPLPAALALARRTIGNRFIGDAVGKVVGGIKEGGGLTVPLAAAGVLPRMAIGFLRTGEETSELGPMLERLADVLDRDVKLRLQRLIGVLTPMIVVLLGAAVAAIVASIMAAILGFNDLAVTQ